MSHFNFKDQKVIGKDFSGQDLTGSNFRGATITGCNFSDSILHFCNFKDAKMSGNIFSGAKAKFSVGLDGQEGLDFDTEPKKDERILQLEKEMVKEAKE